MWDKTLGCLPSDFRHFPKWHKFFAEKKNLDSNQVLIFFGGDNPSPLIKSRSKILHPFSWKQGDLKLENVLCHPQLSRLKLDQNPENLPMPVWRDQWYANTELPQTTTGEWEIHHIQRDIVGFFLLKKRDPMALGNGTPDMDRDAMWWANL